ncbi:glycosyltransferase family 2 protein [Patescibacteria group bacterium]|nr:glycosyltransferase family 2 protein [Patescibacteria group bacterium]
MKISIIVLSWNTKKLLRNCLDSILSSLTTSHRPPTTEIIVVDNGSTDGSPEIVKKIKKSKNQKIKIRLIENKKNLGFAKGNNQGIRVAKGDLIMFLNSDTIVQKDAIAKLARHLSQNKKAGAVCPLILNKDSSIQIDPVYLRYPSVASALFYYNPFFRKIFLKIPFLRSLLFCPIDPKNPHIIEQLSGAALMVRKKVLDQVGLFDEKIPFYFEDSDLSKRIQKAGWKTLVEPAAQIIHLRGASVAQVISQKKNQFDYYQRNFASLLFFCEKHYSWFKTASIKWALIFNWLIISLFYLPMAMLKPRFWNKILINLKLAISFTLAKPGKRKLWL